MSRPDPRPTGCTCPTDDEIDAAIPTTIHRPQEGR